MKRATVGVFTVAALLASLSAQSRPSIQGAWRLVEIIGGAAGVASSSPQPSLYLFTDRHYSILRVISPEPRPRFADPAKVTEAEALAVWGPLQAQSGTYEIASGNLNLLPSVAKNPDVMRPGRKPDVYSFSLQGDTLTLVQKSDGVGTFEDAPTFRLARIE
jgi:hypothetical protein